MERPLPLSKLIHLASYKEIPLHSPRLHSLLSVNVVLIRSNEFCRLTSQALPQASTAFPPAPVLAAERARSQGVLHHDASCLSGLFRQQLRLIRARLWALFYL